jgi:hypothetical protein
VQVLRFGARLRIGIRGCGTCQIRPGQEQQVRTEAEAAGHCRDDAIADRAGGAGAAKHHIPALDVRARLIEAFFSEERNELLHRQQVAAADVDAAEESDPRAHCAALSALFKPSPAP